MIKCPHKKICKDNLFIFFEHYIFLSYSLLNFTNFFFRQAYNIPINVLLIS